MFLSLCLPAPRRADARRASARRRDLGELERRGDLEREPAAVDPVERDPALEAREALAQDEQSRLEVVVAGRQPEPLVEPQLAVGERRAPVRFVLAQQLPEDPARHALDHVVVVDEDAVVRLVVGDRERRSRRRPAQATASAPAALPTIRLQDRQRGREMTAEDPQQPLLPGPNSPSRSLSR